MENFFFWFGVVSFCIVSIILIWVLISMGPGWLVDGYRYFYKLNKKRNDKPKFEVNELVEWQGDEYKVYDRYYSDVNGDYKFKWLYIIHITDNNYKRDWDNDRSIANVFSDNLKKTGHKKREEDIDNLLQSE